MLLLLTVCLVLNGLVTGRSIEEHVALMQNDPAFHLKFPKPITLPDKVNVTQRGHLQEFGLQSPSIGQIPEYFHAPTPRELWDTQVKLYR